MASIIRATELKVVAIYTVNAETVWDNVTEPAYID